MIAIFAILAMLISYMWVEYFNLVGLFKKRNYKAIIFSALFGAIGATGVLAYQTYLNDIIPAFENDLLNIFFDIFIDLSLVKMLSIFAMFLIFYQIFKKQFTEPLDYIIYISCAFLGFSAIENTAFLFNQGIYFIDATILLCMGYFLSSSIIAYGFIKQRFKEKKGPLSILPYFLMAVLSHGLLFSIVIIGEEYFLVLFVFYSLYFLFHLSFFTTTINNAINLAPSFTYKKVLNSHKIGMRMLAIFAIILCFEFGITYYDTNIGTAIYEVVGSMIFWSYILYITLNRITQLKLIKGRWTPLSFELPISFVVVDDDSPEPTRSFGLSIKGDPYNETKINYFYQEFFTLHQFPYTDEKKLAYIEKKFFFIDEKSFYLVKLFDGDENSAFRYVLLKPKSSGDIEALEKYPLLAVLAIENPDSLEDFKLTAREFEFENWAFPVALDDDSMEH